MPLPILQFTMHISHIFYIYIYAYYVSRAQYSRVRKHALHFARSLRRITSVSACCFIHLENFAEFKHIGIERTKFLPTFVVSSSVGKVCQRKGSDITPKSNFCHRPSERLTPLGIIRAQRIDPGGLFYFPPGENFLGGGGSTYNGV